MQPPSKLATTGLDGVGLSKNELNYMRTTCGKTSYVTYPNKSMKILENAKRQRSQFINSDCDQFEDKPIKGLTGTIWNQMVQIHEEKLRWKNTKGKPQSKEPVSRHQKLSA